MTFRKAADGVTKTGKTKGKNLGDSGPSVGIQTGKGKNFGDSGPNVGLQKGGKKSLGVTGKAMRAVGRNMARANNQRGR